MAHPSLLIRSAWLDTFTPIGAHFTLLCYGRLLAKLAHPRPPWSSLRAHCAAPCHVVGFRSLPRYSAMQSGTQFSSSRVRIQLYPLPSAHMSTSSVSGASVSTPMPRSNSVTKWLVIMSCSVASNVCCSPFVRHYAIRSGVAPSVSAHRTAPQHRIRWFSHGSTREHGTGTRTEPTRRDRCARRDAAHEQNCSASSGPSNPALSVRGASHHQCAPTLRP